MSWHWQWNWMSVCGLALFALSIIMAAWPRDRVKRCPKCGLEMTWCEVGFGGYQFSWICPDRDCGGRIDVCGRFEAAK